MVALHRPPLSPTNSQPRIRLAQVAEAAARWDRAVFEKVGRSHSALGDATLPGLTRLADHSKLWVAIAAGLAATEKRRLRRGSARGLGWIAVASLVTNQVAKRAARRPRPSLALVPVRRIAHRVPTSSSFPSGHSASAAAFAIGVGLEVPELALPLGVLAVAVGYSRVYSGVHYPGDVLAGFAVGAASAGVVARLVPLPSVHDLAPDSPPPAAQPQRPTGAGVAVVINPGSGRGDSGARIEELRQTLRRALPAARVVELADGQDLMATLREAASAAEVLAVSGGDGSVNAGAQVAIEANLPLLVLTGGTLNHFAADLGVLSIDDAVEAVRRGQAVRVAVGTVSATGTDGKAVERYFLNTASVGRYPAFVAAREKWEGRLGKPVASLLAVRQILRESDPIDLTIDGIHRRVALAFIGSNTYEPLGFAPNWRSDLADGHLDVRLLDFSRRLPRSRFALALLFGRVRYSHQYIESHPTQLAFDLPGDEGLSYDGEITDVRGRVSFAMRPDALTVFRMTRT
ncbi:MAG: bmrU [Pseudonocardiales bacterium]|nr:bmrU [Pseudonocardiales bacterium]